MNNDKLVSRAQLIIMEITGVSLEIAEKYLGKYNSVKHSIFSIISEIDDLDKINKLLDESHGNIREALKNI
jgi:N-acetylmuramic acid 6-phosphate (MurNAc-6-P) etherase